MENITPNHISVVTDHNIKILKQRIKKKLKQPIDEALSNLLTMLKRDFDVARDQNIKLQVTEVLKQLDTFVAKL